LRHFYWLNGATFVFDDTVTIGLQPPFTTVKLGDVHRPLIHCFEQKYAATNHQMGQAAPCLYLSRRRTVITPPRNCPHKHHYFDDDFAVIVVTRHQSLIYQ